MPLVYDSHENYPGLVKGVISSKGAIFLHKIEAYLLNFCSGIMAATPACYVRLKDMIEKGGSAPFNANEEEALKTFSTSQSEFLNSRLTRVGNAKRLDAYPSSRIKKRTRNKKFRLLYIGVLEKHPSRGILETAITVNKMKGIQFDIGGFGTLVPSIKKVCEKMDNVNSVSYTHLRAHET